MTAPGLNSEFRRRLPRAPSINVSEDSVHKLLQRHNSMEVEDKRSTNCAKKKRLTPEVVAALLSLDYSSNCGEGHKQKQNKSLGKSASENMQTRDDDSLPVSNTKLILRDGLGLVNIVKTTGQPLGFSLREDDGSNYEQPGGIYVSRLTPGGVVEQHALLGTGDEILEINRVVVKDYKLSDVVAMIQIPKKLTLRIKFARSRMTSGTQDEALTARRKTGVQFPNNNYISAKTDLSLVADSQLARVAPYSRTLGQENSGTKRERVVPFRRTSSSRVLPAAPEVEQNKSAYPVRRDCWTNLTTSNGTEDINLISRLSNEKGNTNFAQATAKSHFNQSAMNRTSNSSTESEKNKRSCMKSSVLQVSNNEGNLAAKGRSKYDGKDKQGSTRLDPGDIKFDIMSTNFGTSSHLNPNFVSHSLHEIETNPKKDVQSKSSSQDLEKTSETFGSSSSLSSSDSPKSQSRKTLNDFPGKLNTINLSRSDMSTCSSHLSDVSPMSSSTESEEHLSKGFSNNSTKQHVNEKPSFLHSLSSDDLSQSHNSWFSKIGNQKRKYVRKFSEGSRSLTKSVGEPYRVSSESTEMLSDDTKHGYKLYPSSRVESKVSSRPVTGMFALDVIKGAQIGSKESGTRDKGKKIKVFCSVDSDGSRQACTVLKKGLNEFQWNESFEIELQRTREIKITVWSRSKKEGDVKCAEGCLSLAPLLNEGFEHYLAICLEPMGILCVKVKFTDIKVLLQRSPSRKSDGVFGFPLETVLRRENSKVPILIHKCVDAINERGLEVTGLYRLCGNAAKKKLLRAQFENNSATVELNEIENPVDVNILTGILKDFLRELPHPLLSHDIRELLCCAEAKANSNERSLLRETIKLFPRSSRATITFLLDHFALVLMNSDVNKMDSHNLAVCIGPVLLCPSLEVTSTVGDTMKDINAIKLLLEIWPKPEQVSAC